MNESPSKRRKTSPITSVSILASNTTKRPLNRGRRLSTPIRPSFMSPTKASLARFNPNLLLPSISAENKLLWPNDIQIHGSGDEAPTESNVGKQMVNGNIVAAIKNGELGSENFTAGIRNPMDGASMQPLGPTVISHIDVLSAESRRIPLAVDGDPPLPKQLATSLAQELRASPPAASETHEGLVHSTQISQSGQGAEKPVVEPIKQTSNHDNPISGRLDEQESQLPYTPTKVPFDDAEPRLPSTPTQLGLEPPPSPPKGLLLSSPNRRVKRKRRSEPNPSPLKPMDLRSAEKVEKPYISNLGPRILVVKNTQETLPTVLPCRNIGVESHSNIDLPVPCTNQFLKTPSLSQRLALFLPFSGPPASQQKSASPSRDEISEGIADLILPNSLQVASTENFDTSPDSGGQNIRQHDITLTSPQHLLIVKIRLNVNIEINKNTELAVLNISSWANSELGSWLKGEAIKLNKNEIEKIIGRYWEISKIRATCWHQCEEEIGVKLINNKSTSTVNKEGEIAQIPPNPKENREIDASFVPNNPPSDNPSSQPLSQPAVPPIPRHLLLQHLGRQSMLFTRSPVSLLITWHIIIAQTGDVQSRVAAYAAFPQRWTQNKGGEALGKVGEVFDLLVVQRGVFESVKIICGLIFGS